MNGVVDAITPGASADPDDLIADLKSLQVGLAPLDDTRDEETGAVLATTAQREAVRGERWMTEGQIASVSGVRASKTDGANFRHRTMMRIQVARAGRRAVHAATVCHGPV